MSKVLPLRVTIVPASPAGAICAQADGISPITRVDESSKDVKSRATFMVLTQRGTNKPGCYRWQGISVELLRHCPVDRNRTSHCRRDHLLRQYIHRISNFLDLYPCFT